MYYGGYGNDCCYPIETCPSYGYGGGGGGFGGGFGSGFALIVVLFILLIIVGACLC
ncbi:YjcZ family sporulation protein [Peribacillus loiseleuriae]|uniref:YjcZ family sporulation protein n=1 Tax=Peribacillus loiseleuriae TaxID=1679170 RepID=UPI0009E3BA59